VVLPLRQKAGAELRVDAAPVPDFTPRMKMAVYFAAALLMLGAAGCTFGKHKKPAPPAVVDLSHPTEKTNAPTAQPVSPAPAPVTTNTFLVTPDQTVTGHVATVNDTLRFVVLTFPIGQNPPLGTRMNIFRRGAIVGEIKITGPQRDDNSVADIVLGDAQKGDEVRAK